MEVTKNEVLKLIQEQNTELNEWDPINDPKSERYQELVRTGKLKGQHGKAVARVSKGRAQSDFIKDNSGVVVGFKQVDYNSNKRFGVFHICGGEDDIKRILNENPELLTELKKEFPNEDIRWTKVKKSVACLKEPSRKLKVSLHPLPGETGEPIMARTVRPQGEVPSDKRTQERMKKILYPLVDRMMGQRNEQISERLARCTVPAINATDVHFIDRHSMRTDYDLGDRKWGNDLFIYRTSNSNLYRNAGELLDYALDKSTNPDTPAAFIQKPLKRTTNKKMPNWSEYQGANVHYTHKIRYQGETPWYELDKYNTSEDDYQVVVKSLFEVIGSLKDSKFNLEVNFFINFGDLANKFITQSYGLKKLKLDRDYKVEREIDLAETNTNFSDTYTVLDNPLIYSSLEDALKEMQTKIMREIRPVQTIAMAEVEQERLEKNLSEMVNKITKQILKN